MELLDYFDDTQYTTDMVSGYALHFMADEQGVKRVINFGDYRLVLREDLEAIIAIVNAYYGFDSQHGLRYDSDKIHYRPHERNCISVRVLSDYVIIAAHDFKTLGKWIWSYYRVWHPSEISKRETKRNCQKAAVSNYDSGL